MALPSVVQAASRPAQRRLRWALQHGVLRHSLARGARAGNVAARVMYEPALVAEPYAAYEELRTRGRLVSNGLVRSAHDHDLVAAVLRSPDVVTIGGFRPPSLLRGVARLAGRGPIGPVEKPSLLAVDGLDHARMRKLVIRSFSARAVARLRTRTEAVASDLLDGLEAAGTRGDADLVRDYAGLLPATVIAEMLGAPTDMRTQFLRWGEGAAFSLDPGMVYPDFRRSESDLGDFERWMRAHVEQVRRDPVPGTILADLVAATDEQGALDDTELVGVAMLLLAAGFETTVNLIGNAVVLLLEHPDQLALLRAHPEHWENAVDEALRVESPVQRTARAVVRDTEVAGETLRAGQLVGLVLGAANRDPRVFEDPARFDVTRANASAHLAFSGGPHYCLGAGLARMEAEVALRALLDRFPDLALDGPPRRRRTRVLRGYDAMPVRLRG